MQLIVGTKPDALIGANAVGPENVHDARSPPDTTERIHRISNASPSGSLADPANTASVPASTVTSGPERPSAVPPKRVP